MNQYSFEAKNEEELYQIMYENKEIYSKLFANHNEPIYYIDIVPSDNIYIAIDQYYMYGYLVNKFPEDSNYETFNFNEINNSKKYYKLTNKNLNIHKGISFEKFKYIIKFLNNEYSDDYGNSRLSISYNDKINKYLVDLNIMPLGQIIKNEIELS